MKSEDSKDKVFEFDVFSMLEFLKIRKKYSNYIYGSSSLMEIYRMQMELLGESNVFKIE